MRQTLYDLRFSFRLLRKQPAFTLLATACLALGIGANASIFSFLNALLLRSLPVHEASRLVVLHRGKNSGFSFPDYQDLSRGFESSGSMLATIPTESSLDRSGYQGQLVTAEAVTGNYAHVLQVGTALGDWFDSEDAPVAVISYRVWQSSFHGDPRVLGQQVRSETQWYTVVGVAPKAFDGLSLPRTTSIWVPLHIWTRQHPQLQARLTDRDSPFVTILARLSSGVREAGATAQLRVIEAQLNREIVRRKIFHDPITVELVRGVTASGDRVSVKLVVTLLFAVVASLLMICCLNVGNLLLARGASRHKEVAIRYSLGATRGRIVRQFLTDSVIIASLGAIGGLIVDVVLVRLILGLVPTSPLGETISPQVPLDSRIIIFIGASALVTIFVFGLLPAWKTSSANPVNRVGSLQGKDGTRLRKSSVIAQVALSFVLLVAAGLFLDTCWQVQRANPGFAVPNRIYATTYISTPEFTPAQIPNFYEQVLTSLRSMPNVRSAGLAYMLPLDSFGTECIKLAGGSDVYVTSSIISPGFLGTLAIPLREGRDFGASDRANTQGVVLINEALAQKLWPSSSPLNQRIEVGCTEHSTETVVGVVANVRTGSSLAQTFRPRIYRAFAQNATGLANIVVEAPGTPGQTMDQIRRALLSQGHGLRVYAVNQLSYHVEQSYWQLRWEAWLLGAFGVIAVLLAALGLYGVVSYTTALRTREFGIRMAIGAQRGDIRRLVVKEGIVMSVIGVIVGAAGAFAVNTLLRSYLQGGQVSVAIVCLGVGCLWLAIVIGACYLPARRSSRIEPAITLRYD